MLSNMSLNPSIFKAYDIRGIYPTEINEEAAGQIAQAYLSVLTEKTGKAIKDFKIVVATDNRLGSAKIIKAAMAIFLEYGVGVTDIGLVSINDYYFAAGNYDFDAGIMATASHNPAEYSGFKLAIKNNGGVEFLSGVALYQQMQKMTFPLAAEKVQGQLKTQDVSDDHLKHIFSFVDLEKIKPFKIVVDSGNGMNGLMTPKIFSLLPGQLIHLFPELDGNFPNRAPNPLQPGAAEKIQAKILSAKADLGVMFDVDGDRIFLLDELGNLIKGDMTLLLLAKPMLKKFPGAGIAYNLICSHAVKDLVSKWGGRPLRSEVGYMNLARHIREQGGVMSGEVSGHYAFKDNFNADNAFIALLLALQTISEDGRPLSAIIKDYQLYARGDELNFKVDDITAKLDKIRRHYQKNILDEIDGLTVEFGDWWFNVRPSNTEPLLRITVEAKNEEELKKRQEEVLNVINS
ncbi:MAG: phosphomannomutase/phosphoglucomutase [Candidatus Komeilibacteria bacterium]|nr:phosphomannomutase/phosphoglucomutase [Candidatus Komeilibacteria bacterium]